MIYFFDINLKLKKIVNPDNALSAIHEHELNNHIIGSMVMDMSYAKTFIDDVDHFGYYYKGNFYLHRIRRVEDSHINETVTVTGRHIFFEDMLYGLPIDDFRPQNRDAAYILKNTIDTNTRWRTVMTDVTGTLSTNFYRQVPWDVIEWVTENFRVEFEPVILFDGQKINGYQLHVANKLGVNKHKRIPFSRVTELDYEIDYSEIITSLAGYGKGEEVGDGHGRRINIADVDFSRNGVVSPIGSHYMEDENITAIYGKDNGEPKYAVDDESFTDIEDPVVLADAMYEAYLEMSRPKMAFSASVIDVGDVAIGDTQVIVRPEYDVFYSVRIHKMIVNLHDPEDADVELGDYEHFKESKVERKSRQADKAWKKRYASAIEQMQRDWDADYAGVIEQIEQGYEQAVIDANAEIQAAEVRMQDELDTQRQQMTENIDTARDTAIEQAEADAKEKADAVQGNLNEFKGTHQQLYDSVTSDILDIDTFLGDKSTTLAQQFADVESDFSGLQQELNGISDDLGVAKTNLQQQLDDAKAELDGLEVGGRNLLSNSHFDLPDVYNGHWNGYGEYSLSDSKFLLTLTTGGVSSRLQKSLALSDTGAFTYSIYAKISTDIEWRGHVGIVSEKKVEDRKDGFAVYSFTFFNEAPGNKIIRGYFGNVIGDYIEIEWEKLEKGTIPTDWTPAPEDTEAKITTLNQQIEFIEGELSAKLEQTDIEPINNKITEYEANFEVSAQNFDTLFEKTELHDGDITQWSAETESNAESIGATLTRVEETEAGIKQAKTDIETTANGLAGVISDVETIDGELSGLMTEFNVEAGRIDALVTETGDQGDTLAQLVIDVGGIETTVANHNDDMVEGFSNVDQRFDSITNTVANIKLNTRNMLMGTTFEDPSLITLYNDAYVRIGGDEDYAGHVRMGPADGFNTTSFKFDNLVKFEAGEDYYLTLEYRTLAVKDLDYLQLEREDGSWTTVPNADTGDEGFVGLDFGTLDWNKNTIRINFPETVSGRLRIGTRFNKGNTSRGWIDVFQPYLTNTMNREWVPHPRDGQNMDEIVDRVSQVEQLVESVRIDVQEVTNSALTQSDITVESDRITIGSTSISSSTLASIISVSPSAIDIITDELNLTGNLNVSGQIESLAISAVTGSFAEIFANTADIGFITGDHIDVNSVMAKHIFVEEAMVEDIMAKNMFSENVKTLGIEAVYADLRSVDSEIMTSNIIKSNWLNVDTALFDRLTADEALISRLTAQTVFAREVETLSIDAVQANITTVMNSMGEVEGGLYIKGPDGREFINNSMLKASFDVQIRPNYAGNNVDFAGLNYVTQNSMWQTFEHFYTDHKGSQLLVSWAVGMQSGGSASEYIEFRTRGFGSNNPIGTWPGRLLVRPGETSYHNQVINLGVPDYNGIQGYLEFRRDPAGTNSSNRVTARVLRVSLIN